MLSLAIPQDELRLHPLFRSLNDEQVERLVNSARVVLLDAGQHLFECRQEARHFFLLRHGRVKLYLCSPDGLEKVVHLAGPGETFAEALMFMDSPMYPVNASALVRSEVIAFSNATFRGILSESIETCFYMLADMSTWLKKQLNEIDALTLQNATLRFSNYLLRQVPAGHHPPALIELEAPKHVIASRLSIQPESFSRILRNMQREGLITVQGTTIVINDIPGLQSLCV